MDLSFPDAPDIQVIVKVTFDSGHVGLWTSTQGPSSGKKIFRTDSVGTLKKFLAKLRNLKILDVDRSALARLPELWAFLSTSYQTNPSLKFRVFVPSRDLRSMLPPWLKKLESALPPLEAAYPKGQKVYPPIEQVFSGLWFDPSRVKVLVIGQDPYHGPGQAHGLAFSYRGSGALPPSLINIFKEVTRVDPLFTPKNGDLTLWFHRGVAMVNKTFTVIGGQANSLEDGWVNFSEKVFRELARATSGNLVVMSWGLKAHSAASYFSKAKVLKSSHPSPKSVTNPPTPFQGNNHFRLANDHLTSRGVGPVMWRL